MCVAAWSDSPNEASTGTLSRGGWLIHLIFAMPSRLLAIHLNNKKLASMDNKNNTKVTHYLDGGDVCGFLVGSVVGGGGGRVHLVE